MASIGPSCDDPKIKFNSISTVILRGNVRQEPNFDANTLFDNLNSLPLHLGKFLNDEETELVICRCAELAEPSVERLVVKFCQVVHNVVRRQSIMLTPTGLAVLIKYLKRVLKDCSCWTYPYALTALTTIAYGNCGKIKQFWNELIGPAGTLTTFADFNLQDHGLVRIAVKCIEGLTMRTGDTYLDAEAAFSCYNTLLSLVRIPRPLNCHELQYTKVIMRSISGISNIILHGKIMDRINLGEVLAICKKYMLFGMGKGVYVPQCLYPGPLSMEIPKAKRIVEELKVENLRGKMVTCDRSPQFGGCGVSEECCFSSETDFSDDEVPRTSETAKWKNLQGRVRQCALQTLSNIIKVVDRKVLSGYWSSFLPDSASSTGTLLTVILMDSVKRTRVAALSTLSAILETSCHYWALADDRDEQSKPRAFTSLSLIIAHTVHEILRGLLLALASDGTYLATTHILKCMATLVANVPVSKLKDGFLTRIAKATKDYLLNSECRDTNCEVAAMAVFEAIVLVNTCNHEVLQVITSEDQRHVHGRSSWLMELCIKKAGIGWTGNSRQNRNVNDDAPLPLRLEALQVLTAITKNYIQVICHHLLSVTSLVGECLEDNESSVRLHGLRFLEVLGKGIAANEGKQCQSGHALPQIEAIYFWKRFLSTCLPPIFTDDKHPYLKAKAVDCVATIGHDTYATLPFSQQIHCMALLIGLANDEDKTIQAAAVRALGLFVLFPSLRRDDMFMSDICDILLTVMRKENADLKVKAAWTLGNFMDALVLNKEEGQDDRLESVINSENLIRLAKEALVAATKFNERIKSNAVRALGNFLRFIPNTYFDEPVAKAVVDETVEVLIKMTSTSSSVKVNWNSCYALGNLLHNTAPAVLKADWRTDVLRVLSTLVRDSKNFKVRINAAVALAVPTNRNYFGPWDELVTIWKILVEAIKTAQEVADYTEYNHKEQLMEQLCCTICRLISLMTLDDFDYIAPEVRDHNDLIQGIICRHAGNSGKAGDVIESTIRHIAMLRQEWAHDVNRKRHIDIILNVFSLPEYTIGLRNLY